MEELDCSDVTLELVVSGVLAFFFLNDTATTEIYTLSLHDALPILRPLVVARPRRLPLMFVRSASPEPDEALRSEEHTSELQSTKDLVCRFLLEKKKTCCDISTNRHSTATFPILIRTTPVT